MEISKNRGKVLWIDDEIQHLKPHILFLEKKGYSVSKATNGNDGIEILKKNTFSLVLLDQSMSGIDGLETLKEIRRINSSIPVIMITKTEDEWLMDEAITGQIEQFLIKPVNPSQILMACKQVLEKNKLGEQKAASDYLKEFQKIELRLQSDLSIDEWWEVYNSLVDYQIAFDAYKDTGLNSILDEQIQTCNRQFTSFINKNYKNWIFSNKRPILSVDVISKFVVPHLKNDEKICLIVIDCLRLDQFKSMMPILEHMFNIVLDYKISLLPTATPYSRNAIFSGMFADEMVNNYPEQGRMMSENTSSLNQFEDQFLNDQLKKFSLRDKIIHYHKIWAVDEGIKIKNRIQDFMRKDMLAFVINFVDILAHNSSQSNLLKEMVPDESGYRKVVKTWLENSWLIDVLEKLRDNNFKVIITSDHGSIRVKKDVMVAADKDASTGVRYKYGRNIKTNDRNALVIDRPDEYKLPVFGQQPTYIIAKNDVFFVYPNQANKYLYKYKNSFQHGGISMEELLVPIATLTPR